MDRDESEGFGLTLTSTSAKPDVVSGLGASNSAGPSRRSLLQVVDLTVRYGSSKPRPVIALQNVSFDVAAGETVGLLGESGCGKTTLALTMLGLLPAAGRVVRGAVTFCDTNLLGLSESEFQKVRGAKIAMVHQEPGMALNPVIRVGEQVSEVLRAHEPLTRQGLKDETRTLLEQVGFTADSHIWEAYPHQLSGGQRQRVAIAQAIACRPRLVIADEPTTALDIRTQLEILALFHSLKERLRLAILFISHDPGILAHIAERVFVMYAGRLVEKGSTQQVLEHPLHPYTRALLRSRSPAPVRDCHKQPLEPIPGDPPDLSLLPAGCSFESRCQDRMERCRTCQPGLFQPEALHQVACLKYAE